MNAAKIRPYGKNAISVASRRSTPAASFVASSVAAALVIALVVRRYRSEKLLFST